MLMTLFIICGVFVLGIWLYKKFFKVLRYDHCILFTGGVKTGKSSCSFHCSKRQYRISLIRYYVQRFFLRLFAPKKLPLLEKPLYYSNIPVKGDYVPLTLDLVLRTKRFSYGSVVHIDEASLFADSMDWKNDENNRALCEFCKLIAHETKGGYLFFNTQNIKDLHYAFKRNVSSFFYIQKSIKIPFFMVAYIREMYYSDDSGVMNVFSSDVEDSVRRVLIPKLIWKFFDCYTYSALTDDLPVVIDVVKGKKLLDLKSRSILRLPFKYDKKSIKESKNDGKKVQL